MRLKKPIYKSSYLTNRAENLFNRFKDKFNIKENKDNIKAKNKNLKIVIKKVNNPFNKSLKYGYEIKGKLNSAGDFKSFKKTISELLDTLKNIGEI